MLKTAPASVLAILGRSSKSAATVEGIIPHGEQHNTLVSLAGTLRRRGLGADAIEAALTVVNRDQCEVPGPPENVRRIAESVAQYEPDEPLPVVNVPTADVPNAVECVGDIVFESFDDLFEAGIPDPEVLIDDLLYTEGVHLISGHPGCGKTTIVQHMALMAMAEGRHIVWLDYEAGRIGTARRLLAVGLERKQIAEQFHYAGWPAKAEQHIVAIAQRWPGAVVVMDSLSKALAFAGISENANDEVTRWTVQVVKACKDMRAPIVIIDHITKGGTDSDYSRGAGAKLADVDVHWRVLKVEEFNRAQAGLINVKQKKDREGFLPSETWWEVGDGNGKLTLLPTERPSKDTPNDPAAPGI